MVEPLALWAIRLCKSFEGLKILISVSVLTVLESKIQQFIIGIRRKIMKSSQVGIPNSEFRISNFDYIDI